MAAGRKVLTESYGDATLLRTIVLKWHKTFKEGRENVEDDPCSGKPISSTNDQNVCGVSCDGKRLPLECQDDCRRNGLG
jgi:hypothetical protein